MYDIFDLMQAIQESHYEYHYSLVDDFCLPEVAWSCDCLWLF